MRPKRPAFSASRCWPLTFLEGEAWAHTRTTHTHTLRFVSREAGRSLSRVDDTILNYTQLYHTIPYHAILYYIVLRSTRYCTILYFTTLSRADFLSGSQASRNKVVEGMLEQDNIDPNLIRMLSGSILESLLSALFSSQ